MEKSNFTQQFSRFLYIFRFVGEDAEYRSRVCRRTLHANQVGISSIHMRSSHGFPFLMMMK